MSFFSRFIVPMVGGTLAGGIAISLAWNSPLSLGSIASITMHRDGTVTSTGNLVGGEKETLGAGQWTGLGGRLIRCGLYGTAESRQVET